ncbi:hypothetical protein [Legionella bononiensis]|uniref:Uncharacterized protein n=1 Tax=Legionella bononiensis TaxID=2793102 RepID=A0ABS1W9E0_9GAMM|nr:hypothetical protein [Legionella bononiensis]MBL7480849.1 hypothetical protein [Legionella bononiensis]MBL7525969.1 hypothetical protein [Legionella bononiensis]MBL7563964.1 hypothetical protein [Legionella bononiensis]
MIEQLIKELASRPCASILNNYEWFLYSKQYSQLDSSLRPAFINALVNHSGASPTEILIALNNLNQENVSLELQNDSLSELFKAQEIASEKIFNMKNRRCFKNIDLESLSISRAEWLTIIRKYEQQDRLHVTPYFFFNALSSIRKVKYDDLTHSITKPQPRREAKRSFFGEERPAKRTFQSFRKDEGINPLILEETDENRDLQLPIEATGARYSKLSPATPDKRYPKVAKTPGGSKARPLCTIDEHTLYKHLTPESKAPREGRVNLQKVSRIKLMDTLPKLQIPQAEEVQFIATLEGINERSGLSRRQSQYSITKVKASDVFRAHGIEIKPADGRAHHWSHLIAHFLGDTQELITPDPQKEIINLVPTTDAANYNTLEAVELFVRKKLIDEDTDEILIKVKPQYNDDSFIPDMLIYTLSWIENHNQKHSEIFYINPQSYQRITKSMHSSIEVLRENRTDMPKDSTPSSSITI